MRLLFVAPLALATACAAQQPLPVLTPEIAAGMSAATLCLGRSTFRPGNTAVAEQEIARRGLRCEEHQQAVEQLMREREARRAQQAAQPVFVPMPSYQPYQLPMPPMMQPPPMPTTRNCTTYAAGGQLHTTCQ